MNKLGLLLVFAAALSFAQQSATPAQLTQVPPKPTCVPLLRNGSCADLWRNYNDAVAQRTREELQLYVARQKEQATAQATAPLQQQITDQQAEIKKLQEQVIAAHQEGLQYGGGIGAGAMFVLFGLVFGIRKLAQNFSVTKKPQSRAASA
jgi:hypothetical protein